MNRIFDKRFWRYFVIAFVVMQLLAVLYTVNHNLDKVIAYSIPFASALEFSLVASLLLLPSSLCCAVSLSSFVAFRYVVIKKISDFFKLLGMGLICFLALSFGVYLYEYNIQPQIKIQSLEMLWGIKTHYLSPEKIKDKLDKNPNAFETPDFKNSTLIAFSKRKLQFRLDSIEDERNKQILECEELLEVLPSELAAEAYQVYRLEEMGVEYQFAQTSNINSDSLYYIQQILLYNQASQLSDSISLLKEYRIESSRRAIGAICLLLAYLLFAALGYCLRNKTMTRIFGIIAIVIVSIYFLHATNNFIVSYMKQTLMHVR